MRQYRRLDVFALMCLVLVIGTVLPCVAAPARLAPPFPGTAIPSPPQQAKAWSPPRTELPEPLVSATTILFQQGLADPRGCEYREIGIGTGSCWGGSQVTTVHGWVLPVKKGEEQRFAVCWNGLVYPVVEIGQPAELRVDVDELIRADEEMRAKRAKERPDWPFSRLRHAIPEASSASHASMLPLKACLLLRVGETKLAERVWAAWGVGMPARMNNNDIHLKDPYLMLAEDWLWALFDRAVCAHMRSDDNLALASARQLIPAWNAVEKEAEKRGFKRPYTDGDDRDPKYLDFLKPTHVLLADQERRAKERQAHQPAAETGRAGNQETGIARLIQSLDGVSARQWGQPGGVSLAEDSCVQALIRQGDAAVEPLLACLESDDRLTRSVHFHRDFFRHRSLIGVHEAAYVALAGILQTSFFGVAATGDDLSSRGETGRRKVADEIRAYWARFQGLSLEERWYKTLVLDDMHPKLWLQAAANIMQPGDVEVQRGSMIFAGWTTVPERKRGQEPELRGEELRAKANPSVTELLAKRAMDMSPGNGIRSSDDIFSLGSACDMALLLATWDPVGAVPTLRALSDRCQALLKPSSAGAISKGRLITRWAAMATAQAKAGNEDALWTYLDWLQNTSPERVSDSLADAFRPLWQYRDHPRAAAVAEHIFNAPDSTWREFLGEGEKPQTQHGDDLLEMPLICLPACRRYLLRQLGNRAEVGTVTVRSADDIELKVDNLWSSGTSSYPGDPQCPKPGAEVAFRVCDLYTHFLSKLDGTPLIKLYWPERERDRAVGLCTEFLGAYGSAFRPWGRDDWFWSLGSGKWLDFPVLDHPASKEDVDEHRAIFCLDGKDVRLWAMPERPLKATWITLKNYPIGARTLNAKTGKTENCVAYDQQGHIWQAEEMLVDGQWKRFFGFVGRYCVAKVPGEEIEFPNDRRWSHLSGGIDAKLDPPGREEYGNRGTMTLLGLADSLVAKVSLRNRRGIDQPVPQPKVLLATLSKATSKTGAIMISTSGGGDGWTVLETKHVDLPEPALAARTLAPTEEMAWFSFDLHDVFTIKEPGKYSISLTFEEKEGQTAHGRTNAETFSIGRAKKD